MLPDYSSDDYVIRSFNVKLQGSSGVPQFENDNSNRVSKSQLGLTSMEGGFAGYWFNKNKRVHCIATEQGEVIVYIGSSSSSYSSSGRYYNHSYNSSSGVNIRKFTFNGRTNACCFVEQCNTLLLGLQNGAIYSWTAGKDN